MKETEVTKSDTAIQMNKKRRTDEIDVTLVTYTMLPLTHYCLKRSAEV